MVGHHRLTGGQKIHLVDQASLAPKGPGPGLARTGLPAVLWQSNIGHFVSLTRNKIKRCERKLIKSKTKCFAIDLPYALRAHR